MASSKAEKAEIELQHTSGFGKLKVFLKTLGPGLVTGASDDDPSGIGTYAQTGALFGYTQLWTALFTFPMMTVIQEICARIGLETGLGLAEVIRKHYPKPILYFCVALLLTANTINIGADLGAMAASGQMLLGIPFGLWLLFFTLLTVGLEIFIEYRRYSNILRYLTLSLLAFVPVAFLVPQDWAQALRSTLIPTIEFSKEYLLNLVAILGTTISPYLFFWQTGMEVEEQIEEGKIDKRSRRGTSRVEIKWMRTDVISGMFVSNAVMWFIIVTTASTLYVNGIHNIDSAPKAAQALRPLGGDLSYFLFGAAIIGTGLLAVPVLAGSAAYAVAETFKLREGLYLKFSQAGRFYAVIAVSTCIGAAINLMGINPIQALYYTAVINGLVAPPLLFMIMLIANNRKIMRDKTNRRGSNILGWLTTAAMTIAAAALVLSLFVG